MMCARDNESVREVARLVSGSDEKEYLVVPLRARCLGQCQAEIIRLLARAILTQQNRQEE